MSPLQEALILAVIFVVSGILAKLLGRRDNDPSPKINELAVSTSVSLMTLSKIFSDIFTSTAPSHWALLAAAIGFSGPLLFAVIDRYVSWHAVPANQPAKKKIWLGIVGPNLLALCILFLYYWLRYNGGGP